MPNNRRQRGDYFERRTRAALEDEGWLVVRAAGSLGVADLVALRKGYTPRLISCKAGLGKLPRRQAIALAEAAEGAGAWGIHAWPARPGYVAQTVVTKHGTDRLPDIHMPARRAPVPKPSPDALWPPGEQLSLPWE